MSDIWNRLSAHRKAQGDRRIDALFADDADRAAACTTRADGLVFDWSKTMIDKNARDLLIKLAGDAGVEARRDAMFAGERINETEGRAVLHTALRNLSGSVTVDGQDV
ncbi:MAG: glucose-6-phosphate isomerase, partial [Paracoccus sp. (in: a-proteobacteria)]